MQDIYYTIPHEVAEWLWSIKRPEVPIQAQLDDDVWIIDAESGLTGLPYNMRRRHGRNFVSCRVALKKWLPK